MDPSIQYFRYPKISDDLFDPESKVRFKWIQIRHVQQKIDFQKFLLFAIFAFKRLGRIFLRHLVVDYNFSFRKNCSFLLQDLVPNST